MKENDLLTPSLQESTAESIYSVGALLAAAFFGGSVAVCIMATLNAYRLNSLRKDVVWLFLALATGLGILLMALNHPESAQDTVRMVNRGTGLMLVGAFYILYKKQYRSMAVLGIKAPSPYAPVIAACLVSFALTIGLVFLNTLAGG